MMTAISAHRCKGTYVVAFGKGWILRQIIDGQPVIVLRFEDGNYLKLRQWEQFEVEFDLPGDLSDRKYFVVAKGYYLPLKK